MSRFSQSILCFTAITCAFPVLASNQEELLQINGLQNVHRLLGRMKVIELRSNCDIISWEDRAHLTEQWKALNKSYKRIVDLADLQGVPHTIEDIDTALETLYEKMAALQVPQHDIEMAKRKVKCDLLLQGKRNLAQGESQIDAACNTLSNLHSNLTHMKRLIDLLDTNALCNDEQQMIEHEFAYILENFDSTIHNCKFGEVCLLTGGPDQKYMDFVSRLIIKPGYETTSGEWTLSYKAAKGIFTLSKDKESYTEPFDYSLVFRNGIELDPMRGFDPYKDQDDILYSFANGARLKNTIKYGERETDVIALKFKAFDSKSLGLHGLSIATKEDAKKTSTNVAKALDTITLEISKLEGSYAQLMDLNLYLSGAIDTLRR